MLQPHVGHPVLLQSPLVYFFERSSRTKSVAKTCFEVYASLNLFWIFSIMTSTDAKAPFPISPQASFFSWGSTILIPLRLSLWTFQKPRIISSCCIVNGCCHIAVFIAGANKSGLPGRVPCPKSHARTTQDIVSSQNPWASLARVWADKGAISIRSAQSRRSMCRTGSPSSFHPFHSSSATSVLSKENDPLG